MVSGRHKAEGLGSWGTGEPGTTEPLKLTLNFLFPCHKQVWMLCCHWQNKLKGTAEPCCIPPERQHGAKGLHGGMKGDGGTRILQGEWVDKRSGGLQGAGVLVVWWWDGAGVVHPVSVLLGFPWKGDITPTSVSPRHQMRGSAFSTLWQFLQPQLPGAVSL